MLTAYAAALAIGGAVPVIVLDGAPNAMHRKHMLGTLACLLAALLSPTSRERKESSVCNSVELLFGHLLVGL